MGEMILRKSYKKLKFYDTANWYVHKIRKKNYTKKCLTLCKQNLYIY